MNEMNVSSYIYFKRMQISKLENYTHFVEI